MPYYFSRKNGKHNPKTLLVVDYISLQDRGLLTPDTANCGFKIYASRDNQDQVPVFTTEEEYIARLKQYFTLLIGCNVLRDIGLAHLDPIHHPTTPAPLRKMASSRRPSVRINGLESVEEDVVASTVPKAPVVPTISNLASPPSSASPQRGVAKMNMLRRMRPPPFQHAWTFYHDKHADHGNYEGRLTLLLENIITLKPFWEAYNSFPLDRLQMKDSVHFFKRGVKPVWEDPRNVKGGAWTFRVPKDKSEETWKEILLLAVGEQFADAIQPKDDLCGISLSVRFNSNLIMIWNRDGTAQASIDGIRDVVLNNLSPEIRPKDNSYYYKQHSDHAGFSEVVAKAAEAALISGKIEEARVRDGEVERMIMEEEELEAEEAEKSRKRSQTVT
ncbi:hypothetical protein MMC18_007670 [Xylographa bjoerkii]|nr:hypothetical protein [Xylographa bjoerkii]